MNSIHGKGWVAGQILSLPRTLSFYMKHSRSALKGVTVQTGALLAIMASAYIALNLNVQGFVGMLPFVQREFSLSGAQAGLYTSFYFLSATAVAVFSGRIVDWIGPRNGLAIGTGTVGVMMILHAASPAYSLILALAFVTGVGFSLITPSVSKGVISYVSATRRAGAMGIVHGLGGVGALAGSAAMPALAGLFGWRSVLTATSGVSLLVAAGILLLFNRVLPRAKPGVRYAGSEGSGSGAPRAGTNGPGSAGAADEAHGSPAAGDEAPGSAAAGDEALVSPAAGNGSPAATESRAFGSDLKRVLSDRTFLSICVLGIAFGMSLSSVIAHMTLFLVQDLNHSPAIAGLTLSWFHIGGVIGQPSWGYINDRFFERRRRRGLLLLAALTAAVSLFFGLVVITGVLPVFGLFAASAFLGFSIFGMPGLYFTTISELVPEELTGLATGVALVFSRAGVVLAAPVFGVLSDVTGDYRMSWIALAATVGVIGLSVLISTRRSALSHAIRRRVPGITS